MVGWFAVWAAKGAFVVVNLVIAYDADGAIAVGILGLASYLAPAILAPFAGLPVARWPAERVLLATNVIRGAGVLLAIVVIVADGPIGMLYVAVAIEAGASAFTRPLHMALLPCLARTPAQLVAANVTSSAAEGVGMFVGPAVGGLLLGVAGPVAADLAVLAAFVIAIVAIARVHAPDVGRGDGTLRAVAAQLTAGLGVVVRLRGPRLIIIGLGLQTFVRGLLTVLIVVAAFELLGMGESGVGVLNAAIGFGAILGAGGALALAGRDRLVPAFIVALAGWGLPILVVGVIAVPSVAVLAMIVVGLSNAVLDVAGFTLLQRTTPNERRIAVLGLVESVAAAGPAIGGILAPVLIAWLGTEGALMVAGAILPVAAVALWPFLQGADEGGAELAQRARLLARVPLFAPLSLATTEYIATRLQPIRFERGAWLMREGESGDAFIVIESGDVEVSRHGRVVRTEGPGAGVGEIALLRDVPRTASVLALDPVTGFSVDRASFLEAVTGHAASRSAAVSLVQGRLAGDEHG